MNTNPRHPVNGIPTHRVEIPRPYNVRVQPPPVSVMTPNGPGLAGPAQPMIGTIPSSQIMMPQHYNRSAIPMRPLVGSISTGLPPSAAALHNLSPVDFKTSSSQSSMISPYRDVSQYNRVHVPDDQPLDLSTKTKSSSGATQNFAVLSGDQPLDLRKTTKPASDMAKRSQMSSKVQNQNITLSPNTNPSPGHTGSTEHALESNRTPSTSSFSAYISSADSDSERTNCHTPNNMSSITSLIGNHPIDDILYLHCKRCQSSYGSVHAFRKHFRNSHGQMPTSEDVLIQSIKATKEFVATANNSCPFKLHCSHCGWQCDPSNQTVFYRHVTEHDDKSRTGLSYRCFYCKELHEDPNSLRQHVSGHSGVYPFVCVYCNYAFPLEDLLSNHLAAHHNIHSIKRMPVATVTHPNAGFISASHMAGRHPHPSYLATPNSHIGITRLTPSVSNHSLDHGDKPLLPYGDKFAFSAPDKQLYNISDKMQARQMQSFNYMPPHMPHNLPITDMTKSRLSYDVGDKRSNQNRPNETGSVPHSPNVSKPSVPASPNASVSSTGSVSSAPSLVSPSSIPQSNGSNNNLNLMFLLDKVVEQGIRNPDSAMNPQYSYPYLMQSAPSYKSQTKGLATTCSNMPYKYSPPVSTYNNATSTAHRMAGKTIIEHITETVTRELISQHDSSSVASNNIKPMNSMSRDELSVVNGHAKQETTEPIDNIRNVKHESSMKTENSEKTTDSESAREKSVRKSTNLASNASMSVDYSQNNQPKVLVTPLNVSSYTRQPSMDNTMQAAPSTNSAEDTVSSSSTHEGLNHAPDKKDVPSSAASCKTRSSDEKGSNVFESRSHQVSTESDDSRSPKRLRIDESDSKMLF